MVEIGILYHAKKQARYLELFLSCLKELSVARQVSFFLFSIGRFDPVNKTAHGWHVFEGMASHQTRPIPSLLCNFALHTAPASIAKMRQLRVSPDHLVINPVNRFQQLMLFDMLRVLPDANEFLPPYRELLPDVTAEELIQTGLALILPEKGLHRSGAALIQQGEERCFLQVGTTKQYVRPRNLLRRLQVMLGDSKRLLLRLPEILCLPDGAPLEARVYLLKDEKGKWQSAQAVAKRELFDGQQGEATGSLLLQTLKQVAPEMAERCTVQILQISRRAAEHLDCFIPNIGYLTFDYLLGRWGDPVLTAVSGFEPGEILCQACGEVAFASYVKQSVLYGLSVRNKRVEGGAN